MTPLEIFAVTMNQFKEEAEAALLEVYGTPEQAGEVVNRVLEKVKVACKDESPIAVFLACGSIVVNLTRERIVREIEGGQPK